MLDYLRSVGGEATRRDIARALGLKGDARTRLRRVLKSLQEEGGVERGKGVRFREPGTLPAVTVVVVESLDENGDALARPALARERADGGERITVRLLLDRRGGRAPGVGDRVLARLTPDGEAPDAEGLAYEGRVIRVLPRAPSRVLGVVEEAGRDGLRLRPATRGAAREMTLAPGDAGGAKTGEMVLAEVDPGARLGLPRARVVERLGRPDDPAAISLVAALEEGLRLAFPEAAVAQAERAKPVELGARVDLRELPLVTIDGDDARDFDDAVHAAPDDDPANPGGWVVTVAIADVAHYVRPGDALDEEARERGNSAYFPDRVLPMLPEALSNGLCSLRPDEDRACLAVRMTFDAGGHKSGHGFVRGLMRSKARLTYERAQAAMDGAPDEGTAPLLDAVIRPLYGAYAALEKARRARGTLDLDLPEMGVVTDEARRPVRVEPRRRLDSHRLIELFMIAANVAAAESLEAAKTPCMYRVHDRPDAAKIEALTEFLAGLGHRVSGASLRRPADFQALLDRFREHELAPLLQGFVLRCQSQAAYGPDNLGHFGLNLKRYAHFTSPIRRYADLLVHRALIRGLGLPGEGGLDDRAFDHERFARVGEAISACERKAMAAERRTVDRYIALYLAERVGAVFEGVVASVQRFGLFVRLDAVGADGLVPVSTLGETYFRHDAGRHVLIGEGGGPVFGLGDRVRVELLEADPVGGGLVLRVVDHAPGTAARAARAAGGASRQKRPTLRRRGPPRRR